MGLIKDLIGLLGNVILLLITLMMLLSALYIASTWGEFTKPNPDVVKYASSWLLIWITVDLHVAVRRHLGLV